MKSFTGYLKRVLDDSYVLLANGGEKPISDFLLSSGGTITGMVTLLISNYVDGQAACKLISNNREIGLHVGSGGVNRGIYDWNRNQWIIHTNDSQTAITNGFTTDGRVIINTDIDAEASNNNSGSLMIGTPSGRHLLFDANEIISAYNNSAAELYLQHNGGTLNIGGEASVSTNVWGTITMLNGPIYTAGNRYSCIQGSNGGIGGIHLNNSDITGVNCIITSDNSEDWTESLAFKRSNGNHDTFRASDGKFYFEVNNGSRVCLIGTNYIYVSGATSSNMNYTTGNPRLIFSENWGTLTVGLVYTDYDAYRPAKGIKCMDLDNSDTGNVWFEAQGNMYAANFYTTSDRSKKQNIFSFSEHIRKFQLKDTEKWHYGVIALEVPEMFRDGEEGNMTVNYNSVLAYYIGQLENRVKELEAKLGLETPPPCI